MEAELVYISLPVKNWGVLVNVISKVYPYIKDELLEDEEFLSSCKKSGYRNDPERLIPEVLSEISFLLQKKVFPVEVWLIKQQWMIIHNILIYVYNDQEAELEESEEFCCEDCYDQIMELLDSLDTLIEATSFDNANDYIYNPDHFIFEKPE